MKVESAQVFFFYLTIFLISGVRVTTEMVSVLQLKNISKIISTQNTRSAFSLKFTVK